MSKFRLDRLITVDVVEPVRQIFGEPRFATIPILMYHGISDQTLGRHPYFETNTSPAVFASHLRLLRDHGYQAVSLRDAYKALDVYTPAKKLVAITFDDGLRNFYRKAMPVLADYGFSATMFVVSGLVGQHQAFGVEKDFMTWNEVREIEAHGIQIGSHTVSHPRLESLSRERRDRELTDSRKAIEDQLGKAVSVFSYPYAFPEQNRELVSSIRRSLTNAGYEIGVSTAIGTADRNCDRYFLPRIREFAR